jgi:hypothetical protein
MVRSTLVFAAVLSIAATSLAGDLVTPMVPIGVNHSGECILTNVSSRTIPIDVQALKFDGSVVAEQVGNLVPGVSAAAIFPAFTELSPSYCRFVKASASKVRASLTVTGDGGDFTPTLVVPAQ